MSTTSTKITYGEMTHSKLPTDTKATVKILLCDAKSQEARQDRIYFIDKQALRLCDILNRDSISNYGYLGFTPKPASIKNDSFATAEIVGRDSGGYPVVTLKVEERWDGERLWLGWAEIRALAWQIDTDARELILDAPIAQVTTKLGLSDFQASTIKTLAKDNIVPYFSHRISIGLRAMLSYKCSTKDTTLGTNLREAFIDLASSGHAIKELAILEVAKWQAICKYYEELRDAANLLGLYISADTSGPYYADKFHPAIWLGVYAEHQRHLYSIGVSARELKKVTGTEIRLSISVFATDTSYDPRALISAIHTIKY